MTERFVPNGKTPSERAVDMATYQDATLRFAAMAEKGDGEMERAVIDRVEGLTGDRPASLSDALKLMLEYF